MIKSEHKDALDLAKRIIAFHEFEPQPDPNCEICYGTGRYEEESGHNGDFYETSCACIMRNRPYLEVCKWDKALHTMAKNYVKKSSPRRVRVKKEG